MLSEDVTINHQEGVHTRPAAIFVREAGKFKADISLSCDGAIVNGKSIMGLLMLALGPGSVVTLSADGPDEKEALAALAQILSGRFT